MRIAIGGIAVECCTFSPLPTRLGDFLIQRGDESRDRYPFLADYPDVECVPLLRAQFSIALKSNMPDPVQSTQLTMRK